MTFHESTVPSGPSASASLGLNATAHGAVILPGISAEEHRMLEVLVGAIQSAVDENAGIDSLHDEVAQLQAAMETLQSQIHAPRPSRKVIAWALDQVKAFPAGLASGVAASYLPMLVHAMHG